MLGDARRKHKERKRMLFVNFIAGAFGVVAGLVALAVFGGMPALYKTLFDMAAVPFTVEHRALSVVLWVGSAVFVGAVTWAFVKILASFFRK